MDKATNPTRGYTAESRAAEWFTWQKGVAIVSATALSHPGGADILRHIVSDEELEAAAEETALSFTFQTSAYNQCCQ